MMYLLSRYPRRFIYEHFIGSNWTYNGSKFFYNGSLAVGESAEFSIVLNTTKSGNFQTNVIPNSIQTGTCSNNSLLLV